jgi:geranylgeranyl diphosphate synthase type I
VPSEEPATLEARPAGLTEGLARAAQDLLARYQERVTAGLERACALLPSEVAGPGRYHLGLDEGSRPGKALRPTLTMLVGEGLGADRRVAAHLATAVQLVHDFSLAHDDIVDEDRARRGQPALWVRHGVPTALNTGDALLTLAFQLLADRELDPEVAQRAAAELSRATLEMVAGQQADIAGTGAPSQGLSAYMRMVELKTGALMGAATALGAIAAGAGPDTASACEAFGRTLGIAFQLRDDALGVFGDEVVTGKPVGNDLVRGKQGLPLLLALGGNGGLGSAARSWLEPPGLSPSELPAAVALLRDHGVADRCQGLTTTWTEKAINAAARLPLQDEVAGEIEILCRWLGERAA